MTQFTAADLKTALTVTSAAKEMGLSRQAVWGMLRRYELVYVSLGVRHKRIPRSEVDRWVQSRVVRGPEDDRRLRDGRRKP